MQLGCFSGGSGLLRGRSRVSSSPRPRLAQHLVLCVPGVELCHGPSADSRGRGLHKILNPGKWASSGAIVGAGCHGEHACTWPSYPTKYAVGSEPCSRRSKWRAGLYRPQMPAYSVYTLKHQWLMLLAVGGSEQRASLWGLSRFPLRVLLARTESHGHPLLQRSREVRLSRGSDCWHGFVTSFVSRQDLAAG